MTEKNHIVNSEINFENNKQNEKKTYYWKQQIGLENNKKN